GGELTPAADAWGLGATLYAVLEGHPPYDKGESALQVVAMVVHGEPPRPESTGPLAELVTALMVKEPADRLSLAEVRDRLRPLLPSPTTPLLSDDELAKLTNPDQTPTRFTPKPAAPPTPSPPAQPLAAQPFAPPLAPAPGPLPFESTDRPHMPPVRPGPPGRGRAASMLLVTVAVLLFLGAAGGGFALARVAGGESVLPLAETSSSSPTPLPETPATELETRTGDAATVNGEQGGGFSVGVPAGWVQFVEERVGEELSSTRVYYVSPDGTRTLTVERFPGYFPDHTPDEYVDSLDEGERVTVTQVDRRAIVGLAPVSEAERLIYRTTTSAANLETGKGDLNRVTFANLLPLRGDLWVLSVTVPVEQEDSGRTELFDRIAKTFEVTG
ncbi:MAG TPA: serine/threonine protein kinase, partial [Actinophytocola sp.]|nr:serine/threonine protein kinase [Actinophytocola sp.]